MNETESRICAAYKELVEHRPIESISIQMICDKAGLSRKTFSRHFGSMQEVAACQMKADFVQPINDLDRLLLGQSLGVTVALERNLNVLKENAPYYTSITREFGINWFTDQLAAFALELDFSPYAAYDLGPDELDFVEHYFAYAVASVFRWWLQRGMDLPTDEVARYINNWLYAHNRELGVDTP